MAYINKGDLLVTSSGRKVIAVDSDYDRRVGGTGEYMDDWRIVPSIDVVYPDTGVQGTFRLSDVKKVS